MQEAMYRTLPPSLVQPCVVRSKVEDPTTLLERQQLQQTKSIHELSKIRNINEFPVPGNVIRLPDVPLPRVKNILNYIARPPQRSPRPASAANSQTYHSYESAAGSDTVESTPLVDERVNHGINGMNGHGYESGELVESRELVESPQLSCGEPASPPPADHFSLADQIRATPERSLRNKKKKNRRSHEAAASPEPTPAVDCDSEEIPPPLPPKRLTPSPKKGLSLESQPSMEEEIEAVPVRVSLHRTISTILVHLLLVPSLTPFFRVF